MRANLLMIIATILWGVWGVANDRAVTIAHPFDVQWMYAVPYVLAIPVWFMLARRAAPGFEFNPTAFAWAVTAALCAMGALVAVLIALIDTPASIAMALTSVYPIITLVVGVIAGTESFSLPKIGGILFIIGGVFLLQMGR